MRKVCGLIPEFELKSPPKLERNGLYSIYINDSQLGARGTGKKIDIYVIHGKKRHINSFHDLCEF